ncbi:phage tail tape measure protein [Cognatiluteimonas telluris]|uniref:phage tail tape measure protein n=1 Tax=Cognatiluteimonas telluris TaxID=1104775 RepID=UPI0014091473|nr:phage tail length tape measure family protein [Lysobacter telluris]
MTESIGTARLDLVVDTSNFDAGVSKAKRSTEDMAKSAKRAADSMEQNSKRQVASLEKQIATLGKSREEIIRWRIETQTAGETQKRLLAAHDAATAKLITGGKAMNAYGQSAKQTAAALRGVPAQITDIAVALQGGQRPLTVFLQQGGQLKDMFGGIVPAARALGGAVLGLVNPYTLAAAATFGLLLAWKEAADEAADLSKALILTGNAAELTSGRLSTMVRDLDASTNATAHGASSALAAVAATGKFTTAQFEEVAKAAINLHDATGRSIQQTIAEFASLADKPLDAIVKLNDAIGDGTNVTHFLTGETLRQIEALKEQGREADAVALAFKLYSSAINTRTPEVVANISVLSAAWRDVSHAAGQAFDKVVDGFRRQAGAAKIAAQILAAIPGGQGTAAAILAATPANAQQAKPKFNIITGEDYVDTPAYRARQAAEDEFGKIRESHLSKAKQLETEIAHIRDVGRKAGIKQSEIEEQVAAARAAAAASGGGGKTGTRTRTATAGRAAPIDLTKGAADDLARQVATEDRATQSFLDMVAALDGPLAQAEREHQKRLAELEALAKQSPTAAAGLVQAKAKEAAAYAHTTEEIKKQLDPVGQVLAAQEAEIRMIGKTNAERAVMNALIAAGTDLRSADAQAALAQARANQTEAESRQKAIDLMDDFRRGASDALTDFVTGAKSAKDALKDFFNELAQQITRAIADKWIDQLFGQQGTNGSGTSGGGWLSAIAGLVSGSGGGWGGIAKGAAFPDGVTAFANGGVVDRATMFTSGGRLGVYGEAGPEAILPLHKGPDGKLGVRMERATDGGQGRSTVVNQTVVVQGLMDSKTPGQIAQASGREQRRWINRNR